MWRVPSPRLAWGRLSWRPQFRLRTLLVGVAVFGVLFGSVKAFRDDCLARRERLNNVARDGRNWFTMGNQIGLSSSTLNYNESRVFSWRTSLRQRIADWSNDRKFGNLCGLTIDRYTTEPAALLRMFPEIMNLEFRDDVGSDAAAAAGQLLELKMLRLSKTDRLNCVSPYSKTRTLSYLALNEIYPELGTECLQFFVNNSGLKYLELRKSRVDARLIQHFPELEELWFEPLGLETDELQSLKHLTKLKALKLNFGELVNGVEEAANIPPLPSVTYFQFYQFPHCNGEVALAAAAKMPNLEQFVPYHALRDSTDEAVEGITHLKSLSTFYIAGELLTDRALIAIGALPNLRTLVVQEGKFSATGIRALRKLSKLMQLFINYDSLDREARNELVDWLLSPEGPKISNIKPPKKDPDDL